MKDVMKIAAVNFPAVWGDKEKNLSRILDYIDIAGREGVQMLVFPETALTGYDVESKDMPAEERMHRRLAETIPGNATDRVCELTGKYDMYVIFGMAERDSEDSAKVYNAAAVCGPDGLVGSCRKLHLPFAEALWACPGDKPYLFDTPWGPVSVSICYDSYCFPEITRYTRAKGARLHINCTAICTLESPGAGGYLGNLALQYLAMNNDMFIASSNLCGRDLTSWFMGGSSIIGPSSTMTEVFYYGGKPFLADGADESGLQSAVIDLSDIRHSFMNAVWAGGMERCDWTPERYMEWYKDAADTDYWKNK